LYINYIYFPALVGLLTNKFIKLPEKARKSINSGDFFDYFLYGRQKVIARPARGQRNRQKHD
jgi:hypothetical protein